MHTHCKCAKKRGATSELNEASFSAAANDFVADDDFTEKEKQLALIIHPIAVLSFTSTLAEN